jgi:hypothetical protein
MLVFQDWGAKRDVRVLGMLYQKRGAVTRGQLVVRWRDERFPYQGGRNVPAQGLATCRFHTSSAHGNQEADAAPPTGQQVGGVMDQRRTAFFSPPALLNLWIIFRVQRLPTSSLAREAINQRNVAKHDARLNGHGTM